MKVRVRVDGIARRLNAGRISTRLAAMASRRWRRVPSPRAGRAAGEREVYRDGLAEAGDGSPLPPPGRFFLRERDDP